MMRLNRTEEQKGKFSFDGENHFPRIERLLKQYWDCKPEVDIERAQIYTDSYKQTEGEDVLMRRAKAFYAYCEQREIRIPDDQLIVGDTAKHPRGGVVDPVFHGGWLSEEYDTISTRKQDPYLLSEENKRILQEEIFPYWEGKSVSEHWLKQIPPHIRELAVKTGIIDVEIKTQSAAGETAPYWEMLVEKGLGQIKDEAKEIIASLDETDPEDFAKKTFFDASLITLEGMSLYIRRFAELAEQMAADAEGARKEELQQIAANCYAIENNKPATFWEGLQYIYFLLVGCLMEGNGPSYSPGRMDQYLNPLYEKDIEEYHNLLDIERYFFEDRLSMA